MKAEITLILIAFLMSCQNRNEKTNLKSNSATTKSRAIDTSLIDLLNPPKSCTVEVSGGRGLQGTDHSNDSTGLMGFADFYDCPNTYQVIFLYKGKTTKQLHIPNDSLEKYFKPLDNLFNHTQKIGDFEDFVCYAFIYPQRDPEKQDDIHAMNIDFPVIAKSYKKIGITTWQYKGQIKAATFEELSEFKFRTIYNP